MIGAWEVLGRQVDPLFMSYPSAILVAGVHMIASGELQGALFSSLQTLADGVHHRLGDRHFYSGC